MEERRAYAPAGMSAFCDSPAGLSPLRGSTPPGVWPAVSRSSSSFAGPSVSSSPIATSLPAPADGETGATLAPVLFVGAILLAIFVLPAAWGIAAVVVAGIVEIAETVFWIRLSRRRRVRAGPEAMIGARGVTVTDCRPLGQVRVVGELWRARCEVGASPGEAVRITGRDGLTLVVEPWDAG